MRHRETAMRAALSAAGIEARPCAVHGELRPCRACERAFQGAERQRAGQWRRDVQAAHSAYLTGKRPA